MELITTGVSAQTTVAQYDHVAAAAYLMKHTGTTALIVTSERTGQPVGIITQADIARAITDGKDLNDVRVQAVMTTRPVPAHQHGQHSHAAA
ncbi:MAG TPA: CBS domain-containing protein [Trebonia sp.]|jgi:CBS domain-containing protein